MAGEDLNGATDGSSIKPVSSLRSHFEGLNDATTWNVPAPALSDKTTKAHHQDSAQITTTGRASLDLPRPQSPWGSRETSNGERPATPECRGVPLYGSQSQQSPKNGYKRPMSMDFHSTAYLTPSVTIHSPKSPARINQVSRKGSRSPDGLLATTTPRKTVKLHVRPLSRSPAPATPESPTISADRQSCGPSQGPYAVSSRHFPPRISSIPPVVNRAEKPRISSKFKVAQAHDTKRLTPELIEIPEQRVSPFSTPPSSECSPSPERQAFMQPRPSAAEASKTDHRSQVNGSPSEMPFAQSRQPPDPMLLGFSGPVGSIGPRDPGSLSFNANTMTTRTRNADMPPARASTVSERPFRRITGSNDGPDPSSSDYKRGQRHVSEQVRGLPPSTIPKIPASGSNAEQRDPSQHGLSIASSIGSQVEGLARRAPPLPPVDKPRTQTHYRGPPPPPPPSNKSAKPLPSNKIESNPPLMGSPEFPPPPKRATFEEILNPLHTAAKENVSNEHDSGHTSRPIPDDSDESEEYEQDLPVTRSEYPDSSQANRRPPQLHQGPQEIFTKFDSRVFDVCGQYVCTTGYVTRVWDLSHGEQIFSMSHGDTVKMVSLAFKPGKGVQDEGTRVWVGSNIGELHEVDLATQAIVATSAVHNRREVIRILRHKKDLWTLDDEGKLFIWQAEESRMPSLKHSHYAHRLPKGHSFSLAVGDVLWYATGKEIRIFRPGEESSFSVLPRPLSQPGTGDITCGTYTSYQGARVYLGHTDGKVSIYSGDEYVCIGVIKASDYKINAIAFVGQHLWAAYKTGKIYVYDTTCTPWKVKKDWRAHDGPTASLLLDPSSIWKLNRLQVASLGHDNCIRFWDGMLEEDWLEAAMQDRDVKYCTFREIRAAVVTWNVGACNPYDIRSDFISDAIHVDDPPELLVFGFQEIVDLEDKAITAKSIFGFGKKKDKEHARSEQHVSRVYREWRDFLGKSINRYLDPRHSYTEVHTSCLIGLFQCIFVRQEEKASIWNLSAGEVKCGMKGHYGNKGALITRFMFDHSSLCFINCHLAAGQTQTSHRNNDIASILEADCLPVERNPDTRTSVYVGGGDGTQVLDHEICILNGDLNYRIDAIPRDTVISMVNKGELEKLLERDQIMVSRRRVSGFRLGAFTEAPITFAPTYKYDVGSDKYDSSEKKRSPAWCDRLLYRGVGRIKQVEYRRHEIRVSDHRPVSGTFKLRVKKIDPAKQEQTRSECHAQFAEVRRRHDAEASIEYLVSGLGFSEQEARAVIKDKLK